MKQISLEKLGSIVESKRKELGLSQEELGDMTNIHRQTIGRIELKRHLPSLPQLNSLLKSLEINFEEIIEERTNQDVFLAMLGETKTEVEKAGFKKMISMMLCLRKHDRLRRTLNV
jgi:transcriptional regulator with XRE-family HTH domain